MCKFTTHLTICIVWPWQFQLAQHDDVPMFPGAKTKWTTKLEFVEPDMYDGIPVYRVMDRNGVVLLPDDDPKVRLVL